MTALDHLALAETLREAIVALAAAVALLDEGAS